MHLLKGEGNGLANSIGGRVHLLDMQRMEEPQCSTTNVAVLDGRLRVVNDVKEHLWSNFSRCQDFEVQDFLALNELVLKRQHSQGCQSSRRHRFTRLSKC